MVTCEVKCSGERAGWAAPRWELRNERASSVNIISVYIVATLHRLYKDRYELHTFVDECAGLELRRYPNFHLSFHRADFDRKY